MRCPYCQAEVQGSGYFCQNCGASMPTQTEQPTVQPIVEQANQVQQPIQSSFNNTSNNSNRRKKTSTGSTLIIILIIAAIFIGIKMFNKDSKSDNSESGKTNPTDVTTTDDDVIVDSTDAFLLYVEDSFGLEDGIVVTGRVTRGSIKKGDKVQVIGMGKETINTEVTKIEQFRKEIDSAGEGENVGLYLKDVKRDEAVRGQAVVKPNTIKAHEEFEADLYFYTPEEGGRNIPFYNNFRPNFYFYTAEQAGIIEIPDDVEKVNPGDNVKIKVDLTEDVAIEVGSEFTIREGGKTLGEGTVTKVY